MATSIALCDFGVARDTQLATDRMLTTAVVGDGYTPEYAAPEQLEGGAASGAISYALGVMLLELLAGERLRFDPAARRLACRMPAWLQANGSARQLWQLGCELAQAEPARRLSETEALLRGVWHEGGGAAELGDRFSAALQVVAQERARLRAAATASSAPPPAPIRVAASSAELMCADVCRALAAVETAERLAAAALEVSVSNGDSLSRVVHVVLSQAHQCGLLERSADAFAHLPAADSVKSADDELFVGLGALLARCVLDSVMVPIGAWQRAAGASANERRRGGGAGCRRGGAAAIGGGLHRRARFV